MVMIKNVSIANLIKIEDKVFYDKIA